MSNYKWKPFTLLVSAEEVERNMVKLKVGDRVYKRGDPDREPATVKDLRDGETFLPGEIEIEWDESGTGITDPDTLIYIGSPLQTSPIREVARREIESGKYGIVRVGIYAKEVNRVPISIPASSVGSSELREAAHTLNQIAEYLESEGK